MASAIETTLDRRNRRTWRITGSLFAALVFMGYVAAWTVKEQIVRRDEVVKTEAWTYRANGFLPYFEHDGLKVYGMGELRFPSGTKLSDGNRYSCSLVRHTRLDFLFQTVEHTAWDECLPVKV
ncbi:MAG: hypothetical protein WDN10_02080 [bacterium]